jgi:predicted DCC family thiol-disulfide oxidoreductase YuxK
VRPILLFDGVCNLCTGSVQFVLRRDPRGQFRFASLQSPAAHRLLADHGLDAAQMAGSAGSLVLIADGRAFTRSEAALGVAARLTTPWPLLARLGRLAPRRLRDLAYNWVARHRYRWFGQPQTCWVPGTADGDRFLA